jgi:hypothetical protein
MGTLLQHLLEVLKHLGKESMSKVRRATAALFAIAALGVAMAPVASANATAPTEGGNGAGKSGQCTGAAADRPASCQSSK